LDQHPDITESTKQLYFLDEHVNKMVVKQNGSIPQFQAQQAYATVMMHAQTQLEHDYGKLVLDLTPNYMFEGDQSPARIFPFDGEDPTWQQGLFQCRKFAE
jgi:hypothetical protein